MSNEHEFLSLIGNYLSEGEQEGMDVTKAVMVMVKDRLAEIAEANKTQDEIHT